jgi:hypothetical protein
VQAQLEGAGLVVRRAAADNGLIQSVDEDLQAGDVAGLDPSGSFADPGSTVTLFVVPQRDRRPAQTQQSTEVTSQAPTTSARSTPPSQESSSSPASSPATAVTSSGTTTLSGNPGATESPAVTTPAADEENNTTGTGAAGESVAP